MHTGAYSDISWEKDGKQIGFFSFPYSIDRSPYYQIKVPVCRIRNGDGPSLLLMAGNHGDEYEGELTLLKAMRTIEPADVTGSLTIMPAANLPAVMAAKRCSPLDGGNLNRAFPGDHYGQPTWRIAHFLEHEIFPRHEVVLDIHSGGTSMDHLICSLVERMDDRASFERALKLMKSMRLPYGMIADNGPDSPTSMAAARRAGCIGLSGEFGGGATATKTTMAITARAVDNLLQATGITTRPILYANADRGPDTILLSTGGESLFVYAEQQGWFEPAVDIGDTVSGGDMAGWLHDLERPMTEPQELRFEEAGIVLSRRLHTHSQSGDCLVNLARFEKD